MRSPAPGDLQTHAARARVLIVEDNVDGAESLRMLLEVLGHRVRVAHDGLSALAAASLDKPDVMLVDIGLPGMDGYEVARRLRQDPELRSLLLVALTGYGREQDREQALTAGFDYHMTKPADPDALRVVFERVASPPASKLPTVH